MICPLLAAGHGLFWPSELLCIWDSNITSDVSLSLISSAMLCDVGDSVVGSIGL